MGFGDFLYEAWNHLRTESAREPAYQQWQQQPGQYDNDDPYSCYGDGAIYLMAMNIFAYILHDRLVGIRQDCGYVDMVGD